MITTLEKRQNQINFRRVNERSKTPKMTIALGMRLKDGIILAADRLLSTERHQFEDEKVTVWPLNHGEIFLLSPILL